MNPVLIKSYEAAAEVAGNRILAFTGDGTKVAASASDTAPVMGVGDRMDARAGGLVDAVQVGLGDVKCGGPLAAGDPVTSDAQGRAVKAVRRDGAVVRTIGFIQAPAVENDIAPILVQPGVI